MLDWSGSSRGKPNYFAKLDRTDAAGISAAIVEAWTKFLDGLDAVAPEKWSIVLAYLVIEAGDIALYPTTREQPGEGMETLSVNLGIKDWAYEYVDFADKYHEGANPETGPDARAGAIFERKYNALLKKMARALKEALADPALAPRFAALAKRKGFAIDCVDQGETVHTANLVYLWGERPPNGFPASTPRELFTGLMNKASIWPGSALKLDGDKVIEATFFGAEFNDKYVEILDSVPNVTELCKDLRVLILQATRIKPAGVERLKALFPQAELRVQSRI
jgi:hypothetical protein